MIDDRRLRGAYVLCDLASTNVAFFLYNIVRYNIIRGSDLIHYSSIWQFLSQPILILEQIFFPLVMLGIYAASGYYNSVFQKSRLQEFLNTASMSLIGMLLMFFTVLINDLVPQRRFVFELILPLMLLLFVCVYIPRVLITNITSSRIKAGVWGFNTLIIGTSQQARNFEKKLRNTANKMGLKVVGYVAATDADTPLGELNHPVYRLKDLAEVCQRLNIKKLIVVPHRHGMRATTDLVNSLFPLDLPIFITPDVFQIIAARPRMLNVASEPLIDITRCNMSESTKNLKRISDIVISSVTLLVLLPVFAVFAVLIKRDSAGPVFFKQERIGRHKKPFYIYKLRSMTIDAEAGGPALSTIEDPRITKVGRFMRKYRIDELPQFWNVLKGDMSIVGPRPEREFYIKQIVARAPHYTIIHQLRPGITSWGMVKYGYASTIDEMVERLTYDILYMENVSFVIDIKILIYTIRTVFTGRGI